MDSHYSPRREPYRRSVEGRQETSSRSRYRGNTPATQHPETKQFSAWENTSSSSRSTRHSRKAAKQEWRRSENRARRAERRNRPRRVEDTSLPRHRKKPRHGSKLKELWKRFGLLRIVLGIVLTVILVSTIHQAVQPPEGLEENEVSAENAPVIEPSAAVELFIPAIDVHAEFEAGSCRVVDGAINPDTMDKACTYTAEDRPYSLPGTNANDIVVISGHTGAGVPAVFNNLYDGAANEHKVSLGDKLYVRTKTSGQNWLIYTATDLHEPQKSGLSGDTSIWGEGPMPGRLLTISCIQPANLLEPAVKNAVVGWQFEGTTRTEATAS